MQEQNLRRVTGYCGVFTLVSILFSYVLILSADVGIQTLVRHFPDVIFPGFARQTGRPVVFALWALIAGNLFLIGFSTGIKRLYSSRHWSMPFATRVLTSSMVISIIVSLFSIGILKGLAPVILEAEEISNTLRGTAQSFVAFRNYGATFAGILVALSAIGFGRSFLHNSKLSGYWAMGAGIIGLAGAFWPLAGWLSYLRNFGYLLFLAWVGYTGAGLLRGDFETDTAPDSSEAG